MNPTTMAGFGCLSSLFFRRLAAALLAHLLGGAAVRALPRVQQILRYAEARCYVSGSPFASIFEQSNASRLHSSACFFRLFLVFVSHERSPMMLSSPGVQEIPRKSRKSQSTEPSQHEYSDETWIASIAGTAKPTDPSARARLYRLSPLIPGRPTTSAELSRPDWRTIFRNCRHR